MAGSGSNFAWSYPLIFPTVDTWHSKIPEKCGISRGAPPSSFLILVKKFKKKIVGGGIFHFWGRWGYPTPQENSYKPSRDLWEATLLRRTQSVQRLARSFGTDTQTDTQTSCYFSIRMRMYYYRFGGMFYGVQETLPQIK